MLRINVFCTRKRFCYLFLISVLFPVVRFNSEFHFKIVAFDTEEIKNKTKPNNSFNELTYGPTNPSELGTRLFVKVGGAFIISTGEFFSSMGNTLCVFVGMKCSP